MKHAFHLYGETVILVVPLAFLSLWETAAPSVALMLTFFLPLVALTLERGTPLRDATACSDSMSLFAISDGEPTWLKTAPGQDKLPFHAALPKLHGRTSCFFSIRCEES